MTEPYIADGAWNAEARNAAAYRLLDKIKSSLTWGGYDNWPKFLLPDGTPVTQGELRAVFYPGPPPPPPVAAP